MTGLEKKDKFVKSQLKPSELIAKYKSIHNSFISILNSRKYTSKKRNNKKEKLEKIKNGSQTSRR